MSHDSARTPPSHLKVAERSLRLAPIRPLFHCDKKLLRILRPRQVSTSVVDRILRKPHLIRATEVQCISMMSHAHLREEGTPKLYPGWVRPYSVHHSLVRHSPAFIVEAPERVSPLRPESNTFVYHLLCGRAEDIPFSARRQYWPYISRSFVGLTPDSSIVTSYRQLRDNSV
ncbi:hypothetical protein PROFUN_08558 [Planoprotostelium fungivorum]|uniref:Uncharacterized protein n=1 Tax=Planoprotostelium fungivorum TaxID=1890364 RepID=A0A2P6N1N3_9EUKA|nr:hypothetical protein PROFUN_08558 [Planoprotostelium fungivorum]